MKEDVLKISFEAFEINGKTYIKIPKDTILVFLDNNIAEVVRDFRATNKNNPECKHIYKTSGDYQICTKCMQEKLSSPKRMDK